VAHALKARSPGAFAASVGGSYVGNEAGLATYDYFYGPPH